MSHNTVARATTSLNSNHGSLTLTFTLSYKTTTKRQDFIMELLKKRLNFALCVNSGSRQRARYCMLMTCEEGDNYQEKNSLSEVLLNIPLRIN